MNLRDRYYWWRRRATDSAPSGPTVLLDLNWLTDTGILNMVGAPIENGFYVGTWPFATGGTATSALAIAAGADGGPVYDTANGVGNDGTGNLALTLPSPITIPANTDCVIYIKCVLAGYGDVFLGKTNNQALILFGGGSGWNILNAAELGVGQYGEPTDATFLARARRAGSVWYFAWTGQAETTVAGSALGAAEITVDTLLGMSLSTGLDVFSPTGNYIQKIKIWSGTSDPDTAYETANGGTL